MSRDGHFASIFGRLPGIHDIVLRALLMGAAITIDSLMQDVGL